MNLKNVGDIITKRRKELNITQNQIAKYVNIDRSVVSRWESGELVPNEEILQKLSEILKVPVKTFYKSTLNKNVLTIILFIILLLIVLLIFSNFRNNKTNDDEFHVYEINKCEDSFSINGKIIYDNNQKELLINRINFNDEYIGTIKETKVKEIQFYVLSNNSKIYISEKIINDDELPINDLLENFSIDVENKDIDLRDLKLMVIILDFNNASKYYYVNMSNKDF